MYKIEEGEYYFYIEGQEVHEMYLDFIYSFKEERLDYGNY